jgi:hypothetical protein
MMLQAVQPTTAINCIDLSVATDLQNEEIELDVSLVQIDAHDRVEVQQDGCRCPITVYEGGPALLDLAAAYVDRARGEVAHARIRGRMEIPQEPPSGSLPSHLNFRLTNVVRVWNAAPSPNGR